MDLQKTVSKEEQQQMTRVLEDWRMSQLEKEQYQDWLRRVIYINVFAESYMFFYKLIQVWFI